MQIWLNQSVLSSEPLAAELVKYGLKVNQCPLLLPKELAVKDVSISDDTAVVMTSKQAIWYWAKNYPVPKNVFVMGAGSAAWAAELGINDAVYAEVEGSEYLLKYLLSLGFLDVIVASGSFRRGVLESGLIAAGVKVQIINLYENFPDQNNIYRMQQDFMTNDIVVVSSLQVAEILLDIVDQALWVTISKRLSDWLLARSVSGKVVNLAGSLGLADKIYSCYIANN